MQKLFFFGQFLVFVDFSINNVDIEIGSEFLFLLLYKSEKSSCRVIARQRHSDGISDSPDRQSPLCLRDVSHVRVRELFSFCV